MGNDGEEVRLLIKQYYLGMPAKKELYYKLLRLGVIKSENG
jgi:hypothetical protein